MIWGPPVLNVSTSTWKSQQNLQVPAHVHGHAPGPLHGRRAVPRLNATPPRAAPKNLEALKNHGETTILTIKIMEKPPF